MASAKFSGFLNILKPPGMTSHDVVAHVRRRLPRKTKVGHLGTLDPAASGVLPLAVGPATRLIPLLPDRGARMKAYLAEIAFGVSTSTDDLEGEVLESQSHEALRDFTQDRWERDLEPFQGALMQVPPQVSAIRKDGQRAYERVRKGETVELPARQVIIDSCRFLDWDPQRGRLKCYLVCSTGTYVRSVARDLGEALGVGGALAFLIRTVSGPFQINDAITLEEIHHHGIDRYLEREDFPFRELPRLSLELKDKGQELKGDFAPGQRYLAMNGIVTGLDVGGRAAVDAVFSTRSSEEST